MAREFDARYPGYCRNCKREIAIGQKIIWNGPMDSVHKECPYVPETERIEPAKQFTLKPGQFKSDLRVPDDLELHHHGSHLAVPTGVGDEVYFFRFDRPKAETKWEGWVFVKWTYGEIDTRIAKQPPNGNLIFETDRLNNGASYADRFESLLFVVLSDPKAAMQLYGKKVGRCGYCKKRLTDETSRARGIGPECWKVRGFGR